MKFGNYRIGLVLALAVLTHGSVSWAQHRSLPRHNETHDSNGQRNGFAPETNSKKSQPSGSDNLVTMNFQDIDISVLAQFISEITHRNFIVDEKVRGKVTIISPTKVTTDEAYAIFQSVLQVKGYTTVESGRVVKIVPSKEAKQVGLPTVYNGSIASVGDEFITRLVPLRHVSANEIVQVLQPMVSGDGLVLPYPQTNSLILTDAATNVKRLLLMLEDLDVEGYEHLTEVIPLKHAVASDLAKKIEEILKGQDSSESSSISRVKIVTTTTAAATATASNQPSPPSSIRTIRVLPDERTNSLIVMASPLELKTVQRLVVRSHNIAH